MSNFKTALLGTAAVALAAAAFAAPASAQDANVVRSSFGDKVKVKVTGQVNRAVTFVDDGTGTTVNHVDNDISSSRFRIHADAKVTSDFSIGGIFELQVEPNTSNDASQFTNDVGDSVDSLSDRRVEVFFTSNKFGRVYMGKGPTASDGTSENDASAAGVIGSGGLNELLFGGMQFRGPDAAGEVDETEALVALGDVFNNLDGLSRSNRIRYDTPVVAGFQGRASHLNGGAWDASLWYNGALMGTKIEAAVAYWNQSSTDSLTGYNGSVSVLTPIGIFASIAGGVRDVDGATDDDTFWYADAGYQRKFTELGITAIKVAYEQAENFNLSDEGTMYQIGVVQHIDAAATEIFATYNHFDLDRAGANADDIDGVAVGARIKF